MPDKLNYNYRSYIMKTILLVIISFCLISCILPLINTQCYVIMQEYFGSGIQKESFSNDSFIAISPINSSSFEEIWLTGPDTVIQTSDNLLTGQAKRYVSLDDITYDIRANMTLLNGGVFQKYTDQEYNVVLSVDESEFIELGSLQKDRDHVYKLTKTVPVEFSKYKFMYIIHKFDENRELLLVGKFK